jgi:hypothetical protein
MHEGSRPTFPGAPRPRDLAPRTPSSSTGDPWCLVIAPAQSAINPDSYFSSLPLNSHGHQEQTLREQTSPHPGWTFLEFVRSTGLQCSPPGGCAISMSLPTLPSELVVRCITPLLTDCPASNIEAGVSAAMVVFQTCKRMHDMLRYAFDCFLSHSLTPFLTGAPLLFWTRSLMEPCNISQHLTFTDPSTRNSK